MAPKPSCSYEACCPCGDFDEYWEFHLKQEYKRNHEARYENGEAPKPLSAAKDKAKSSRLRLVK